MLNIEKVLSELKEYATSAIPINHTVLAVNQGAAAFKNRVFNSEAGTKDITGQGLGKYSNSYAKYRKAHGRQIANIDLEFTGSLRRDIKVISKENNVSVAILAQTELNKVIHLEKLFKKNIFDFNSDEIEETNKVLAKLIGEDIAKILNA